jgi:hypothetical protein
LKNDFFCFDRYPAKTKFNQVEFSLISVLLF